MLDKPWTSFTCSMKEDVSKTCSTMTTALTLISSKVALTWKQLPSWGIRLEVPRPSRLSVRIHVLCERITMLHKTTQYDRHIETLYCGTSLTLLSLTIGARSHVLSELVFLHNYCHPLYYIASKHMQ